MKGKSLFYGLMIGMFFLVSSMTGCVATKGKQFTRVESPSAGMSVVYFYRANKLLTNSTLPGIVDNGKSVLPSLLSGGYWKYNVAPGKHVFEPKQFGLFKKKTATVNIKEPGEVHFVEMQVKIGYIGLVTQQEDAALAVMANCFEVSAK